MPTAIRENLLGLQKSRISLKTKRIIANTYKIISISLTFLQYKQNLLGKELKTQTKSTNEDSYRAYLAKDLAEQNTNQKKSSAFLKDTAEKQQSPGERTKRLVNQYNPHPDIIHLARKQC